MPFGLWARMGPKNHVLDGVQIPPWEGAILGEMGAHCKVLGHSAVACAKTAEPIVMMFGLWDRTGPRNHELNGGPDPHEKGQYFWEKGSLIVK